MALPSNTFMFNYNAKEYDAVNHKLPKNPDQILDFDIVFTGTPQTVGEDYLYFGTSTSNGLFNNCMITYNSQAENPFNRDNTSNRTITIVYKTSGYTGSSINLFANRDNTVNSRMNWMVRGDRFHTLNASFLMFTPTADPQIIVVRVSSDGYAIRKSIDVSGNTLQSTSGGANFGTASSTFEFFRGGYPNEDFNNYFYWMYCSLEALTDEEILDVVWYNEGINQKTATGITINSLSWTTDISGTGGTGTSANCTYSAVVDYDDETSETNPSSLKVYGSITAATNPYHNRRVVGDLGLSFVDGAITATTSVRAYQAGNFNINQIPTNNLYMNGSNINKSDGFYRGSSSVNLMCRNGKIIFRNIVIPPEPVKPTSKEIWYTTSDGNIVSPTNLSPVSNTYVNGKGVMTFADDLTTIPANAITSASTLTSLHLPESVTGIGSQAFAYNYNLTAATLYDGLTSVDSYVFYLTNLVDFGYPASVTGIGTDCYGRFWAVGQGQWSGDELTHIMRVNAKQINGNNTLWGNMRLNQIIFSENVEQFNSSNPFYTNDGTSTKLTDIWFEHRTTIPNFPYDYGYNNYLPSTGTVHLVQGVDESGLTGLSGWTKVYYNR